MNKKKVINITMAVAVIAVVGLGVWYYFRHKANQEADAIA